MFERQAYQISFTVIATIILLIVGERVTDGDMFWGISEKSWFFAAFIAPICHHTYVWFAWRAELHYKLISKVLGKNAFDMYATGFFTLFFLRAFTVIIVGCLDIGSMALPWQLKLTSSAIILLLGAYTMYSVTRYFGFKRAAGIDHFNPSYRKKPFVKKGIFRYSKNSMYTFAVLLIWLPAILCESRNALWIAIFNNIYVWVHYFCLEKPDIKHIYLKK